MAAAIGALSALRHEYVRWDTTLPSRLVSLLPDPGSWKTVTFRLRTVRRPWGSRLAIDLKLKR